MITNEIRNFIICEAFCQLLENPASEIEEELGSDAFYEIAKYLLQLPAEDKLNPSKMVNHIGELCYSPGKEALKKWLLRTYNNIGVDDIQNVCKKTGDPDDKATAISQNPRQRINESRDICQSLQSLASNVVNQNNQGNQNATNSN